MARRISIAAVVAFCFIPCFSRGKVELGVGGYASFISGGLEGRINIPVGERTGIFLAPHGFWWPASSEVETEFPDRPTDSYSIGVRSGVMFLKDNWISPYAGAGFGKVRLVFKGASLIGDGESLRTLTNGGGRVFGGVSFAPFGSAKTVKFRIDLDAGLLYSAPMVEDDEGGFFPDLSLGLNVNW